METGYGISKLLSSSAAIETGTVARQKQKNQKNPMPRHVPRVSDTAAFLSGLPIPPVCNT